MIECLSEHEVETAKKLGGNFDYTKKRKNWKEYKERIFNTVIDTNPASYLAPEDSECIDYCASFCQNG